MHSDEDFTKFGMQLFIYFFIQHKDQEATYTVGKSTNSEKHM